MISWTSASEKVGTADDPSVGDWENFSRDPDRIYLVKRTNTVTQSTGFHLARKGRIWGNIVTQLKRVVIRQEVGFRVSTLVPRNDRWLRQWLLACVRPLRSSHANVIYANCNYTACTLSPTARCSAFGAWCAAWRATEFRQLYANLLNSNLTGSHLPPLVRPPSAPALSLEPNRPATNWIIPPFRDTLSSRGRRDSSVILLLLPPWLTRNDRERFSNDWNRFITREFDFNETRILPFVKGLSLILVRSITMKMLRWSREIFDDTGFCMKHS